HYTTDYFYDNTKRGLLKEMTQTIGKKYAILETKPIDFMTKHPNLYKQLKDDPAMVAKMDSIEKMISARGGFYYIKKENVEKIESGIQDGDLIGITTSVPGIDCSHTGIAVREKDGRVHFLHASSAMHKVIISEMPLAEYLANNSKQTGIIIYRPQETK
ncbi:MAG TPA: N-acetylmuramoyl-L-alanine amidase-like domain-containing protein, partial [Candidatus Kapabacteria bacterium]|nr:N-acetylmuramoyl-L-alanine amidase-like domain-containing protein [Candidatus Kapabacteria bacterium]